MLPVEREVSRPECKVTPIRRIGAIGLALLAAGAWAQTPGRDAGRAARCCAQKP